MNELIFIVDMIGERLLHTYNNKTILNTKIQISFNLQK